MPEKSHEFFTALWQATLGLLGFVPTAALARVLWHHRLARLGYRRLWSLALIWEVPAAIFGAIIGGGLAEWLGLSGMTAQAVVGLVAWLGPTGLEDLVLRPLVARYAGASCAPAPQPKE